MNNAEWLSKHGIKLSSFYMYETTDRRFIIRNSDPNKQYGTVEANTMPSALHEFLEWLDKKHVENILTAEEKAYLSVGIEPFRNRIVSIVKEGYAPDEFLYFHMDNDEDFCLPSFLAGTMYKGMKNRETYSLEELGL